MSGPRRQRRPQSAGAERQQEAQSRLRLSNMEVLSFMSSAALSKHDRTRSLGLQEPIRSQRPPAALTYTLPRKRLCLLANIGLIPPRSAGSWSRQTSARRVFTSSDEQMKTWRARQRRAASGERRPDRV
ncbi:unnamed protein product [Pleuronectes platessa]|uniref:Uncharacterized protein n=1 Tax=Pleuronectes platessa TaxID=8262 RepID=A0A9N7YC86_PLEPL|nr:unnamed protein product [Pleuronectes platessa]